MNSNYLFLGGGAGLEGGKEQNISSGITNDTLSNTRFLKKL